MSLKKKIMELNKIYNESNLETMAKMPDNFIDLTVTSPPYDGLRKYNGYSFQFEDIAKELYRVTKQGGVVVWVVGDATINGSESGTSFKQALYFMECGFNLHDTMIYEKTGCSMPSNARYLSSFEFMFVLSKGRPTSINLIEDRKNRFPDRWGGGRKVRNQDGTWSYRDKYEGKGYGRRFNIWRYNNGGQGYGSGDNVSFHPATFPEDLAKDHIYSWSNEGDIIYDPFMGSGTTAKMAHLQKRKWIGSEVSSEYCQLAEKRIAPYLLQLTLF
jgi:DNA modification methylase